MPLLVACFSSYLTVPGGWRDEDYHANKFVRALKGEQFGGYALVPLNGIQMRLANENLDSALDWFAVMVRTYIIKEKIRPPLAFIPVPSSAQTRRTKTTGRTEKMAQAIRARMGAKASAVDCLRWKQNLGSARRTGGPRNVEVLYSNLTMNARILNENRRVVLVDDVMTSGGHLRACARIVREAGANVLLAVCGGRTTHTQDRGAFDIVKETLED
jgi:hypothetical protein